MKPQDAVFIIVIGILLWRRHPKELAAAGLLSLLASIPLFARWIFFTAERLTWYAAAFLVASVIISLIQPHRVE